MLFTTTLLANLLLVTTTLAFPTISDGPTIVDASEVASAIHYTTNWAGAVINLSGVRMIRHRPKEDAFDY